MARGDVYKHISLIRADGSRVPSAFLNLSWNFWDVGQQRLTVLLDPGRIKRGVGPNLKAGPPLAENEAYTLRVVWIARRAWTDTSGSLREAFHCNRARK